MSATRITIDRLELDLRGFPPGVAREAVQSLGPALERALTRHIPSASVPWTGVRRIDAVRAPDLRPGTGTSAGNLCEALAERIAASVAAQVISAPETGPTSGGGLHP